MLVVYWVNMGFQLKCALKKEKYDLVPPDGGWGYFIVVSAVIFFTIGNGISPNFDLIYKDLIDEIQLGSTEISFLNGLSTMCFAISGLLTSYFLNYLTKRQIAIIAALLYAGGSVFAVFANSVLPLYIMFIFQGFGNGLVINVTFSTVNDYFMERRLFANCLIQTGTSLFVMLVPLFVTAMYDIFGFRGSLLMTLGVIIQIVIAALLLQPVEWHMKRAPRVTEETEAPLVDDKAPTVKLGDLEKSEHSVEDFKEENKNSFLVKIFKQVFDVPVMIYMLKSNVSWGPALLTFADCMFSINLPQALYSYGCDQQLVATSITIYFVGDVAGRILFTIFSRWITMGNQELLLIGTVITILARVGFSLSPNTTMVLVFIAILGLARCFSVLLQPLIIADSVHKDKFPAALGIVMVLLGVSSLVLGSVIGAIRDYTDSYVFIFWVLTGLNTLIVISWTTEIIYKRSHKKQAKK